MLKNKKILLPGVVALLLVLVGGYWFMFMRGGPAPVDEQALAKTPGPIHQLVEPFTVNLAGSGSSFARLGVALHISELSAGEAPATDKKGAAAEPTPIKDEPVIRDIVIAEVQKATTAQLSSERGREELKTHIKRRINKETKTKITGVYWTEFAVQ